MNDDHPQPAVEFEATLRTRGGGTGARRVMLENPERGEFIKSFTGWNYVEPGTLTLDGAAPLPLRSLANIVPLETEPDDLFTYRTLRDTGIASRRGAPAYYGGIASAGPQRHLVILSQQPRPAVEHRLEVMADVCLRDQLAVHDGQSVRVRVFHKDDWLHLRERGLGSCDNG